MRIDCCVMKMTEKLIRKCSNKNTLYEVLRAHEKLSKSKIHTTVLERTKEEMKKMETPKTWMMLSEETAIVHTNVSSFFRPQFSCNCMTTVFTIWLTIFMFWLPFFPQRGESTNTSLSGKLVPKMFVIRFLPWCCLSFVNCKV